jgi:hypothetical protein
MRKQKSTLLVKLSVVLVLAILANLLAPVALAADAIVDADLCSEVPSVVTTVSNTVSVISEPLVGIRTEIKIEGLSDNLKLVNLIANVERVATGQIDASGVDYRGKVLSSGPRSWGGHLLELTKVDVFSLTADSMVGVFDWRVLPEGDLNLSVDSRKQIDYSFTFNRAGTLCTISQGSEFFTKSGVFVGQENGTTDGAGNSVNGSGSSAGSGVTIPATPQIVESEFKLAGQVRICEYDANLVKKIPADLSESIRKAAKAAIESCLLKGDQFGDLGLSRELNRAELVVLINRVLTEKISDDLEAVSQVSKYQDYAANFGETGSEFKSQNLNGVSWFSWQLSTWFGADLAALTKLGLFGGYPAEVFRTKLPVFLPAGSVNRAEAVKVAHDLGNKMLTLDCSGVRTDHRFTDVAYDQVSSWYTAKLGCLHDNSIVQGENEGGVLFSPDRAIKKGEFLKILMGVLSER